MKKRESNTRNKRIIRESSPRSSHRTGRTISQSSSSHHLSRSISTLQSSTLSSNCTKYPSSSHDTTLIRRYTPISPAATGTRRSQSISTRKHATHQLHDQDTGMHVPLTSSHHRSNSPPLDHVLFPDDKDAHISSPSRPSLRISPSFSDATNYTIPAKHHITPPDVNRHVPLPLHDVHHTNKSLSSISSSFSSLPTSFLTPLKASSPQGSPNKLFQPSFDITRVSSMIEASTNDRYNHHYRGFSHNIQSIVNKIHLYHKQLSFAIHRNNNLELLQAGFNKYNHHHPKGDQKQPRQESEADKTRKEHERRQDEWQREQDEEERRKQHEGPHEDPTQKARPGGGDPGGSGDGGDGGGGGGGGGGGDGGGYGPEPPPQHPPFLSPYGRELTLREKAIKFVKDRPRIFRLDYLTVIFVFFVLGNIPDPNISLFLCYSILPFPFRF